MVLVVCGAGCGETGLTWAQVDQMIERDFPGTRAMTIEALEARLEVPGSPVRLIDVREAEEYRVSRLPGAVRMQDAGRIGALAAEAPDRPVVLYCSVGYRSAAVAHALQSRGFGNVYNLRGSIFAWANRGLPLEGPEGPTRRVHPYDSHWGRLLEAPHGTAWE